MLTTYHSAREPAASANPYQAARNVAFILACELLKGGISMAEAAYGAKFSSEEDPNSVVLVIEPGKSTLMSETNQQNIRNGLRGHPGTQYETVTVLDGGPIVYRYLNPIRGNPDRISTLLYSVGRSFASVPDYGKAGEAKDGYWHVLEARGIAIILVRKVPEKQLPAPRQ